MQHTNALLFVNGEPPKFYPNDIDSYTYIAATDGAYHNYLSTSSIEPDFIIGDLDSYKPNSKIPSKTQIIHTPDQNKTDFEKAILFLADKGVSKFDVYGACGHASDHFLGNISVAIKYYYQYKMTFYDNYCRFFLAEYEQKIDNVKDHIISLIPLSKVTGLTITGFQYPLIDQTLSLGSSISLRNKAISDVVTISFKNGDLMVFIEDSKNVN
ncbi:MULTISPECIES: thiamine diphosphokinase [unclassified Gilliamella]|uniref:thiamine diphosphokinase n=1 Tax=unclassified Gilliamella TaxID=2685620 RepID=UPI00130C50D9|nr:MULTISPECIES: thiamine diphosphokinase [unclassified Gilliamella]MWP49366.1 thiamine diphosphokinase [Gilliamella sp. Lep-s35]MWP68990.1 thiamine diphosphokinase [Gilliamella sp. Lep-s5]MWP77357.1 thiamine diphosphokinase [Gilliamella sp. Lep-s21]